MDDPLPPDIPPGWKPFGRGLIWIASPQLAPDHHDQVSVYVDPVAVRVQCYGNEAPGLAEAILHARRIREDWPARYLEILPGWSIYTTAHGLLLVHEDGRVATATGQREWHAHRPEDAAMSACLLATLTALLGTEEQT